MATDPAAPVTAAFKGPFAPQVAFFRGKLGDLVPTQRWDDIWQSQHDKAFMVAGAMKVNLLADLGAAVDAAVTGGETLQQFRKRFDEIVDRHGWTGWAGSESAARRAWRTKLIYQTNLQTSYAAGRLVQLREAGYSHWLYRHSGSSHPRLKHQELDGLVKPADDPFWSSYYPPNGWGCGCRVVGVRGPKQAARLGGDWDKKTPDWVGKVDPKTQALQGIDPGWGYQPGATVADAVRAQARQTVQWPYQLAKAYMDEVPATARDALALAQRRQPETGQNARRYAERALGVRNEGAIDPLVEVQPYQTLGLLTTEDAATVQRLTGQAGEGFDWALDPAGVRHIRAHHGDAGAEARRGQLAVTVEDYARLPAILNDPDAVTAAGLTATGQPAVRVVKVIAVHEYVAVFERRGGRRMMALQSFWKRPAPGAGRP